MTALNKLQNYCSQRFLFHGSAKFINGPLLPHDPKVPDSFPAFDQNYGLYATDLHVIAVMYAIWRGCNIPDCLKKYGYGKIDFSSITTVLPEKWKPYILNSKGYVYILERKHFPENNGNHQWISKKQVEPVEIVDVDYGLVERLYGKFIWE